MPLTNDSYKHYRSRPARARVESFDLQNVPHITIIRPVKGLEPDLYQCLASTFQQTYPREKLTIYLCLSDRNDPALATVGAVLRDHPGFDARLYIEDEDEDLQNGSRANMGPNPKIRNISRAYREAKGDVIWAIDCNVWVGKGVGGRMVDNLYGYSHGVPYKFVHHLPMVVDITKPSAGLLGGQQQAATTSTEASSVSSANDKHGSALEETFLTSSHAKFYTAINTVAAAPCILGKSNMFRRSHLNALTNGQGTDFFSPNICEDHLIGDLLWKQPVPEGVLNPGRSSIRPEFADAEDATATWGNHGLCFGDLAIQPIAHMSLREYIARRVRWLRVRKYTVTAATLVEPSTESFLCSAYGAWGMTTLPWFASHGLPSTWLSFALVWLTSITLWCAMDWTLYNIMMNMGSVEVDENTPIWARGGTKRPFGSWIKGWLGREALALPIWTWAVWGGATVVWRGRTFRVGMDMRVHELNAATTSPVVAQVNMNGNAHAKRRQE